MSSERIITVNCVRLLNNPNQACANISVSDINDGVPFDYFIDLANDHDSEIHTFIRSKVDNKEVELLPPFIPQEEYDSASLRSDAESLLRATDQFMTIDTELTEDEIKEMKEYRKSLRSISKSSDLRSLTKSSIPPLPKFLKQNQNHITYIGSDTSQEK